ncbi:MAG: type III polyketide synthase [Desulfocapsaceae bacterium]
MTGIRIRGIGTAVPEHVCDQAYVRKVVENMFSERVENLERLLKVFDHLHIERRYFARDPEWYLKDRGFGEANDLFIETATKLSTSAAVQAISNAEMSADEFCGIVVASTTGVMTPSLEAHLVQELEMPLHVVRMPLFGLGCAGGVAGLARAAELSVGRGGAPVLFVAVEICSATFQRNDLSKSNLIGTSIFGDGAAALVVGKAARGPEVIGSYHRLFPKTYDIMGWDIVDNGMKVRFSRDIPNFVRASLPMVLEEAYASWGISQDDIVSYITHPGGAKVLEAFAEVICRAPEMLAASHDILRSYGNMSSASILFVLEHMLNNRELKTGYALMSALGPGFSSDQLLLHNP